MDKETEKPQAGTTPETGSGTQAGTQPDKPTTPAPVTEPETDTLEGTKLVDPQIRALRDESAARRVENRQLKEQIAELQKQVASLPDVTKKLSSVEENLKQAKADKDKADRTAALVTVTSKYQLPAEVAELLETIPADKLDETAAKLAKHVVRPSGFMPSVGNSGDPNQPSQAKRIFDKINNRGGSIFDPAVHKAKGGGLYNG